MVSLSIMLKKIVTTLLDPILYREWFSQIASVFLLPHLAFMELFHDCQEHRGATNSFKNLPEPMSTDGIEDFCQIYKDCIEVHILLSAFLLNLSQDDDHVRCFSVCSKARLAFW